MEKETIIIRRRHVTAEDIECIRQLIEKEGDKGRTHLSRQLCRHWQWRQPNGAYKEIACRDLLRRLEQRGLIKLPPMLRAARKPGYRNKTQLSPGLDRSLLSGRLRDFLPLDIEMVRQTPKEKWYNGLIAAYHYLGYHQGCGEQLKYLISSHNRLLSCIGFAAAAWRVACREKFIGWDDATRQANLPLIVNNHRFLILPWVRIPNLASTILAQIRKRLPGDWLSIYCHPIFLVETFVEQARFRASCYRADNWIYLGETTGRGRNDRYSTNWLPIKAVYVYPLTDRFREHLSGEYRR